MSRETPPNVLFVVLDTVRADHLSPYGYDRETTPTLDSFAAEARVYTEAVAQAPWTLPSHASMFTGLYPSQHTATQESPYLPPETGTLAAALSASGYTTACYSSNAWITPYTRLTMGFDEHDTLFDALPGSVPPLAASVWQRLTEGRLRPIADRLVEVGNLLHERGASSGRHDSKTAEIVDRAQDFVNNNAEDRWFAFLNLMDAHLPYYPPEPHRSTFAPGVAPEEVCQNSKSYNSGAVEISPTEFDDICRLYDAEISHMDEQLGRLFEHLRITDQWDDTAVVVSADHGELHGEFDLYGHEFGVYDPLVNVPLLIKHPDIDPGYSDEQIELLDLYDTVLDIAGATATPDRIGGRSFDPGRSLLRTGRPIPDGEFAFIEYGKPAIELNQLESKADAAGIDIDPSSRFHSRTRAVRKPDGKYIRHDRIDDEAYRLDDGQIESRRLAANSSTRIELAEALGRFEKQYDCAWGKDSESTEGIEKMDSATTRRLRELGYIE